LVKTNIFLLYFSIIFL